MTSNVERRAVPAAVGLRSPVGDASRAVGGYAARFGKWSRVMPKPSGGSFIERVAPGFFDRSQMERWAGTHGTGVVARYNHLDTYLLGSTRSGTLQLTVDGTGLDYVVDVPETRSDVYELVRRGDLPGSSFTFDSGVDGSEWSYGNGTAQRTLVNGVLIDVAPCSSIPAYGDATVGLRSLAAAKDASIEEVFALAEQDELRRLFTRSDQPQPTGVSMSYSNSQPNSRPTLTAEQAKLIVMAKRIPPRTKAEIRDQEAMVASVKRMMR